MVKKIKTETLHHHHRRDVCKSDMRRIWYTSIFTRPRHLLPRSAKWFYTLGWSKALFATNDWRQFAGFFLLLFKINFIEINDDTKSQKGHKQSQQNSSPPYHNYTLCVTYPSVPLQGGSTDRILHWQWNQVIIFFFFLHVTRFLRATLYRLTVMPAFFLSIIPNRKNIIIYNRVKVVPCSILLRNQV